MLRFTQSKQAASRDARGGGLALPHGISYLMLSVEGSLGLRYLGIGRACIGWPPWVGNMAPLSPDTDRTGSRVYAR